MERRIIEYIKSLPKHFWVLMLIIAVGIFFRTYNFQEWMSFNLDSVRDSIVVSHPVEEGLGSLPLLGPRAGGTQLHLGPVSYYFQYVSGVIFQSTNPAVFAFPDLLFSILSIPLFFLLLREYFSIRLSLVLTAMLATCFLAIQHGRFAWNPNSTPFFSMLFLFSLLKSYCCPKDKDWKKYAWLAVSGASLAIASQLHFSAFLGLPIIFAIFVALNWKKTREMVLWKSALSFSVPIFVLYIPVFVFEFLTNGKNTALFLDAISSKGSDNDILENISQDIKIFARYFLWIAAGIVEGTWWQKALSSIFFLAGSVANLLLMKRESDERKKRFLQLSLIFVSVFFMLYIPLAFEIKRSRFFLPLLMMPFALIGYVVVYARMIGFRRRFAMGAAIVIFLMIFGNMRLTLAWFSNMHKSQVNEHTSHYAKVMEKNKDFWWTLGRFQQAADFMIQDCDKDSVFFFISKKTRDFADAIEYEFFRKAQGKNLIFKEKYKSEYEKYDSCYYHISLTTEHMPEFLQQRKYETPFIMGDMKIIEWYPENVGTAAFPKKRESDRDNPLEKKIKSDYPRILWGDLFK